MRTRFYILMLAVFAILSGCNKSAEEASLDHAIKGMFPPSPQEQVGMAFAPEDADNRREGVVMLSKNEWGTKEPYLKGYATILKTDSNPLVRSAAVRALAKSGNAIYLPDIIAALEDSADCVRWDAAVALDVLAAPDAVEPLKKHATDDSSPDVRMWAAKALRHYERPDVLKTLTRCLADESFGVRFQAHSSLVALTGKDNGFYEEGWADVR